MSTHDFLIQLGHNLNSPSGSNVSSLCKTFPSKRKGKTLADFYEEVLKSNKSSYEAQSAKDLELAMMKNRRLIEAKTKRR
jgi:hypothetical protein